MLKIILFLFLPRFSLMRTMLILRFPRLVPQPLWRMITSREGEGERWSRATFPPLAALKLTSIATRASIPQAAPRQPIISRVIPPQGAGSREGGTMDNVQATAPLPLGARTPCRDTTWTMTPTPLSTLLTSTVRFISTSASTLDATRYVETYNYSSAKLVHKICVFFVRG